MGLNANFVNGKLCDLGLCRESLFTLVNNEISSEINRKAKLRTYVQFKEKFKTEDYLLSYISKGKRSLYSQLRCGIFPLAIETGRFSIKKDTLSGQIRKLKPG